jgi:hypothetical protein
MTWARQQNSLDDGRNFQAMAFFFKGHVKFSFSIDFQNIIQVLISLTKQVFSPQTLVKSDFFLLMLHVPLFVNLSIRFRVLYYQGLESSLSQALVAVCP